MDKRNLSDKRFFSVARRSLFLILFLGVCLASCSGRSNEGVAPTMMPAATEFTFKQSEVETGVAKHQTVLTGFFLGGDCAELAVVNIDENGNRHLRIYAFSKDTWVSTLDTPLRSEVLFVDVVNIGGRDRLITYEQGRLNWFDPDSAKERALVEVTTNYNATGESGVPYLDISRDVNADGLDDLVVPDIDGFWIATQLRDGSFTAPDKTRTARPVSRQNCFGRYSQLPRGRDNALNCPLVSEVVSIRWTTTEMDAAISYSGTRTILTFIVKIRTGCFPRWQRPSLLTSLLTQTVPTRSLLTSREKICSYLSPASERTPSGECCIRSEI